LHAYTAQLMVAPNIRMIMSVSMITRLKITGVMNITSMNFTPSPPLSNQTVSYSLPFKKFKDVSL
jgi:hypothetical protein